MRSHKLLTISHFYINSLRKQPTFCDATIAFPTKWHLTDLRNERKNSNNTDDVSLSRFGFCFWLVKANFHTVRSTTQISVVTSHQYGISALGPQTWFLVASRNVDSWSPVFFFRPLFSYPLIVIFHLNSLSLLFSFRVEVKQVSPQAIRMYSFRFWSNDARRRTFLRCLWDENGVMES